MPVKGYLAKFARSIWLFPAVLTAILVLFTALGINGSSIGEYHELFYGEKSKDPNLILNESRAIRSDEWLVNTQLTIAQKANNYSRVNPNIGSGQDMSLAVDVPYKDWSTVFKPHNLSFLIMPFDNAFAFKWWFIGYLLILSCYFFVLTLLPGKKLWAVLISLTLFLNPFIQWWYLHGTMAPIYYGLWGTVVLIQLFNAKRRLRMLLWGLLLAYLLTCFALILYPPFQIPVAIVMAGFAIGYLYKKIKDSSWRLIVRKIGILLGSVIVASLLAFTFLVTRQDVVRTLKNTDYPGMRHTLSGTHNDKKESSFGLMKTFSAPLSFGLQNERKGAKYYIDYYTNQSEAAAFIKLNLIFAPIVLLAIYKYTSRQRTLSYYLFLATLVVLAIFAVRSFTPFFNLPFRFLLLDRVQNERLEVGFLLLCIIQIALLGSLLNSAKEKLVSKKEALFAAVLGLAFFGNASIVMSERFPSFVSSFYLIVIMVIAAGLAIYLLLNKKTFALGLALFLAINVVSSISVNPLYANSKPKVLTSVIEFINSKYPDRKTWAVFDHIVTENIPQMAGKPALTGVHSYPQLALWRTLDARGNEKFEYNRYAHVAFTVSRSSDGSRFTNPSTDVLLVSFDCDMAKKLPNFGYALSPLPINKPELDCLIPDNKLVYPNLTLYIYKYSPQPLPS